MTGRRNEKRVCMKMMTRLLSLLPFTLFFFSLPYSHGNWRAGKGCEREDEEKNEVKERKREEGKCYSCDIETEGKVGFCVNHVSKSFRLVSVVT